MKKNIGSQMALYPMPVTIIGAMNGEKPTWTLAAHVGIIGYDYILVSLAADHFINSSVKKNQKLSVSLIDKTMLPQADICGSVSGFKEDKSQVFAYEIGENGTPIIENAPLVMECFVTDIYRTEGFENFVCSIGATYVEEAHLNEQEKINYHSLKPVLFEFPAYEYLETGEVLGKCLTFLNKSEK